MIRVVHTYGVTLPRLLHTRRSPDRYGTVLTPHYCPMGSIIEDEKDS